MVTRRLDELHVLAGKYAAPPAHSSWFAIKAVDTERRWLKGLCSTGDLDLQGDTLDPMGVVYDPDRLPPLLWQHSRRDQIGNVTRLRPTPAGIEVEAVIVKVAEPGVLKDLVDRCWQSVKYRVLNSMSVGLQVLESRRLGPAHRHISKWALLEVSLVSVPANQAAAVLGFRSVPERIYHPPVSIR